MIVLYTLPDCGICKVIKTKLQKNQIDFQEKDFSEIASKINSDFAPALMDENNVIYNSPIAITNWINNYKR